MPSGEEEEAKGGFWTCSLQPWLIPKCVPLFPRVLRPGREEKSYLTGSILQFKQQRRDWGGDIIYSASVHFTFKSSYTVFCLFKIGLRVFLHTQICKNTLGVKTLEEFSSLRRLHSSFVVLCPSHSMIVTLQMWFYLFKHCEITYWFRKQWLSEKDLWNIWNWCCFGTKGHVEVTSSALQKGGECRESTLCFVGIWALNGKGNII